MMSKHHPTWTRLQNYYQVFRLKLGPTRALYFALRMTF